MEIKDLAPKNVWSIFDEITKVPRPSKKEDKIRKWLVDFAAKHSLECEVDETGNVIMRKPATPGRENHPVVTIQGHMDMVCEKVKGVEIDFDNDPIQTVIDGEWLRAKGTTLGADDGLGVALGLAALTDDSFEHGPMEALFTYDEETGMTGANNLKAGVLKGKILINLDSEEDNLLYIGCAGGQDTMATFRYAAIPAPANLFYARISVEGLKGGHSGGQIHEGHANALKLLARFLAAQPDTTVLSDFHGGDKHNAIPREAEALIGIPMSRKDAVVAELNRFAACVEEEYRNVEDGVKFIIQTADTPQTVIEQGVADKLLKSVIACPHGVYAMSHTMENLVQTSTNLASVKMNRPGFIDVATSQRSNIESQKAEIALMVKTVFELAGAEVRQSDGYPGWNPNPAAPIVKICSDVYEELFHEKAEILAIHAGLECGLFLTKYPDVDMISFGPTLKDVHTPEERCLIASVPKMWLYLKTVLSRI